MIRLILDFLKKNIVIYYLNDLKKLIFENFFLLKNNRTYFIAIPRSGTTLIGNMLYKFNINIEWSNHYLKPKFNSNITHIVSIRNPIDRFISAFYHTKYNQKITFYKDFFIKYPEVTDLIENLHTADALKHVRLTHVLNEGLSKFYTLENLKKTPPIYIFLYETLHKDIKHFFIQKLKIDKKKINKELKFDYGKSKKKKLNKKNKKKLLNFLKEDIKIYNYLLKMQKKINLKSQFPKII